MTPLTEDATKLLDPGFSLGMGALVEDETKGLRCPVKGCGSYHHNLTSHLNKRHPQIGAAGVRSLLSIPTTASLSSGRMRAKISAASRKGVRGWRGGTVPPREEWRDKPKPNYRTVGFLNLQDACVSQLALKYTTLQSEIGRQPTENEFVARFGFRLRRHLLKAFGGWSNMVAHMGGRIKKKAWSREEVVESLQTFFGVHGRFPYSSEVNQGRAIPVVPSRGLILDRLGTDSWPIAMSTAAFLLGIDDPRYGPVAPEKASA